jgi:hypothetical protein
MIAPLFDWRYFVVNLPDLIRRPPPLEEPTRKVGLVRGLPYNIWVGKLPQVPHHICRSYNTFGSDLRLTKELVGTGLCDLWKRYNLGVLMFTEES